MARIPDFLKRLMNHVVAEDDETARHRAGNPAIVATITRHVRVVLSVTASCVLGFATYTLASHFETVRENATLVSIVSLVGIVGTLFCLPAHQTELDIWSAWFLISCLSGPMFVGYRERELVVAVERTFWILGTTYMVALPTAEFGLLFIPPTTVIVSFVCLCSGIVHLVYLGVTMTPNECRIQAVERYHNSILALIVALLYDNLVLGIIRARHYSSSSVRPFRANVHGLPVFFNTLLILSRMASKIQRFSNPPCR